MCLCPKVVYNRSNHFQPEMMPLMFQVPCGKCDECSKKQRDDWFVRCWSEHMSSENRQSFFYTLTYNNDHLPEKFGFPCFDKRDVQLFCKRLKKALAPACRLKYFVSSEFGEKYGRPHYHVLFFLDKVYNPFIFYKLVEKHWHNGFVKYGDNAGVVNGISGIQYVTKYVTKDFIYTDKFRDRFVRKLFSYVSALFNRWRSLYRVNTDLVLYLSGDVLSAKKVWTSYVAKTFSYCLHTSYVLNDDDKDLFARFLRIFNSFKLRYMPFHIQSTYLGADLAKSNFGCDDVPIVQSNGALIRYNMPRYYRRMFWYDRLENENDGKLTRFVLNEDGIKHYIDSLPKDFTLYRHTVQSAILSADTIKDDDIRELNASLSCEPFEDARSFKFFMNNFDLDLDVLAIYHNIFRGRICTRPFAEYELNEFIVKSSYLDFVKVSFVDTSVYDYGKIFQHDVRKMFRNMLFDNHPFFQPYEMACQIFDAINSLRSGQLYAAKKHDEIIRRKLKSKYKETPY